MLAQSGQAASGQLMFRDPHIQLYNSAQSGADSEWGKKYARRMVASLDPDLVLIAFGQNDFWRISADTFAENIGQIMRTVRNSCPDAEFLLVSTMRFDPAYTSKAEYWQLVGQYAAKLKAMSGPGVEFVDVTAISESVYASKKPMDCLNDRFTRTIISRVGTRRVGGGPCSSVK
jgi:hypothetical protein